MILIKINGLEFFSKPSVSILEACKNVGITIPRFCYHEILSVSGNCRMCLVEIENMEKPVASCVTEVEDNMSIRVDSPFVKKARENVVEALLLNHPLDCPICDQAGECDLQDQAKTFGSSHSRFFFKKKASEDKYCGPLIKTIMTRCITCTRCVRYAEEVAGVNFFGTLNRGVGTEIGSYVVKMFESEISGNVIDLCPVGALTSKPYAFKARPWELRLVESCDTMDALGSNIYVNYKESEILRVLPRSNSDVNENLISDKTRFSYDSNSVNRIAYLHAFNEEDGNFKQSTWKSFFKDIDNKIKDRSVSVVLNQEIDLESIISIKDIKNKLKESMSITDIDSIYNSSNLYIGDQLNVINKLENMQDLSIFLGSNVRLESSILNARVRFKYRNSFFSNFVLGNTFDSNFSSQFISLNIKNVLSIFEGHCRLMSSLLQSSLNCYVFVGNSFSNRIKNLDNLLTALKYNFKNLICIRLYTSCNSEGLKWLNLKRAVPTRENNKVVININPKETYLLKRTLIDDNVTNIFIGTHGTKSALKADYVLPTKTPFEGCFKYLSLEHRAQKTAVVINTVSESRNIVDIFSSLFDKRVAKTTERRWFDHIEETITSPEKYSTLKNNTFINDVNITNKFCHLETKVYKYPIKEIIKDFYLSGRLPQFSKVMLECSRELHKNFSNFTYF